MYNSAGITEADPRTFNAEPCVPWPEVRTRLMNPDASAEDTVYLNDDMEIEDDWMHVGSTEDLIQSDLVGFRSILREAAAGHTPGLTQSGPLTTSAGNNNSVRL